MKSVSKFWVFPFFIITLFTSSAFAGEWKVRAGDYLWRIAANYPGVTAGEICKANAFMFKVKGCNHIEPGWLLVIPEVGDCFDATMTTASKQKITDEWNRRVVSNYKDGDPDCNFGELSKKHASAPVPAPVVVNITTTDQDLLDRIDIMGDIIDDHVNSKIDVFAVAGLGNSGIVGVGGLLKFPSKYALSYQFSGNGDGYSNQLLFGKYFANDFAVVAGPRVKNSSSDNSDAVGVKIALLYTPKIVDSFFGYAELGVSVMKVKEYQENGAPNLSLSGHTLSINTPVERKENNYWNGSVNVFVGIAYKF